MENVLCYCKGIIAAAIHAIAEPYPNHLLLARGVRASDLAIKIRLAALQVVI